MASNNIKELQAALAATKAEYDLLVKTSESTTKAAEGAKEKLERAEQSVSNAQSAFGAALIKDEGVEAMRAALDSAHQVRAQALAEMEAINIASAQFDGRTYDIRIAQLSGTTNNLNRKIMEAVVMEEIAKTDLRPLLRAWSIDSYPDDGGGFGRWLANQFSAKVIQPEEKAKLAEGMRKEYAI